MSLALAPALRQVRLAATLAALGAGARVLVYGGARPAGGAQADRPALAEVALADPPGLIAEDQIVLKPADPAGVLIRHSGLASWARIVGRAGDAEVWLIDCDVSGPLGDGDWRISVDGLPEGAPETQLYEGGTFILGTVTIS